MSNNNSNTPTTLSRVMEELKSIIYSDAFLNSSRVNIKDFTRRRILTFVITVVFLLNVHKSSTRVALQKYFSNVLHERQIVSQQSLSDARQKIKPEAFVQLFRTTATLYYEGFYKTLYGYRFWGIDGTKIQIPDDDVLRAYFGTIGRGSTAATGQASILYDVLNDIVADAWLEPLSVGEREQAIRHAEALAKMPSFANECGLFDRGYPSYELISELVSRNIHFIMRVKSGFNTDIDNLDLGIGYVSLSREGKDDIKVKVIKFDLPSGELETLITDIFDENFTIEDFKFLYFRRWPVETKYNEFKHKYEIENFSGRTKTAILQDFYIAMINANLISIGCHEAQFIADEKRRGKNNKYYYAINKNDAIGAFKDNFAEAMIEECDEIAEESICWIIILMASSTRPVRPGRSKPRNKSPRKSNYRHNKKSNC
jgi:hypothetical protein